MLRSDRLYFALKSLQVLSGFITLQVADFLHHGGGLAPQQYPPQPRRRRCRATNSREAGLDVELGLQTPGKLQDEA